MENQIYRLFDDPIEISVSPVKKLFSSKTVIEDGPFVTIKRFPYIWFVKHVNRLYQTSKIAKILEVCGIRIFGMNTVKVHKFFVPELIYILSKSRSGAAQSIISELVENTWVKDLFATTDPKSDTDMSLIKRDMNVELFDWQKEFIKLYDVKRRRAHLNGELLSFGCGLGKTITSLATMKSVGCDAVVVIAPKSTLIDVWVDHIKRFYKTPQRYFVVGQDEPKDADFYIFNYESMEKIEDVMPFLKKKKKVGMIVDESHNFLRIKSNRSQNLIKFRGQLNCEHCLLMSGTPVKAIGTEVITLLRVIDTFFDDYAQSVFVKAFGLNTTLGSDILHSRLNLIMHRRKLEDVYKLPETFEETIKIKLRDGDNYTVDAVKQTLAQYIDDRITYHQNRMSEYQKAWDEAMDCFSRNKSITSSPDWKRYRTLVNRLIRNGYERANIELNKEIAWANTYEKEVLIPTLKQPLKNQFIECKSKIKYLELCIQGEVLGELDRLRAEMTVAMCRGLDIETIMNTALKKVIFATTYVKVVECMKDRCDALKLNPVCVYGATTKNAPAILDKFRKDDTVQVLIATMQTLSTGVTLTEANTIVFCNPAWRESDMVQMRARVHRLGQDTDCYYFNLELDTGGKKNLSDRSIDILEWSKQMSDAIVEGAGAKIVPA